VQVGVGSVCWERNHNKVALLTTKPGKIWCRDHGIVAHPCCVTKAVDFLGTVWNSLTA
jgi:hypothetical protein